MMNQTFGLKPTPRQRYLKTWQPLKENTRRDKTLPTQMKMSSQMLTRSSMMYHTMIKMISSSNIYSNKRRKMMNPTTKRRKCLPIMFQICNPYHQFT